MNETWLSLDLTWTQATVCLQRASLRGVETLSEAIIGENFDHSERLIACLDEQLKAAGLTLAQIDRYIAPSGPGSFTGLRIALITLKAFALAHGKPLDTVIGSEVRALAWCARQTKLPNEVSVLTKSTRAKILASRYLVQTAKGVSLEEETWLAPEEISSRPGVVLYDDFPLSAKYLGENLLSAKSRKTYQTMNELIALSPEYFGSARFDPA